MLWEVLCDYVCVKIFSPKPDFVRPFFSTKAYVSNIRLSKNFFSGSNICTTTTYNYLSRTNEAAKGNIHFYLVVMGSLKSFRFLQKMTASFEPWLSSFCSLWGSKKRPLWPSNEMILIYRKWHFPAKWAFWSCKKKKKRQYLLSEKMAFFFLKKLCLKMKFSLKTDQLLWKRPLK